MNSSKNIYDEVVGVLMEVANLNTADALNEATTLRDGLGIDSMNSLMVLMRLEESIEGFKVDPSTLEAGDLETIGSIHKYILKTLSELAAV